MLRRKRSDKRLLLRLLTNLCYFLVGYRPMFKSTFQEMKKTDKIVSCSSSLDKRSKAEREEQISALLKKKTSVSNISLESSSSSIFHMYEHC